jgi:nucleoside-diphosphate-sugar epimerase
MKIFITGSTGFVGGRLAQALMARGDSVTLLARSPEKASRMFPNAKVVQGELGFLGTKAKDYLDGMDGVIHCAAHVSPVGKWDDFERANIQGTKELLNAALLAGISSFVNFSSPSVYVDYSDRLGIKESEPLPAKQVSMYGRSKVIADELVLEFCRRGLNACSLRPRGVIGAGDRNILPRIVRASQSGFMPVVRGGEALLDLTVIDNLVDATLAALVRCPQLRGEVINISNGEPKSLRSIASALFRAQGRHVKFINVPWTVAHLLGRSLELWYESLHPGVEPPLSIYAAGLTAFSQTLDISKARQLLDYKPRVTLDEGILSFVGSLN